MISYRVGHDLGPRSEFSFDYAVSGIYEDQEAWERYVDWPSHRKVGDEIFPLICGARLSVQFEDGEASTTPRAGEGPPLGSPKLFRHVILFQWKPEATPGQIEALREGLAVLDGQIPGMVSYHVGTDLGLRPGRSFDFGVVGTFEDRAAWKLYRRWPAHRKIAQDVFDHIVADKVCVQFEALGAAPPCPTAARRGAGEAPARVDR
jgi:hypothetical protein